MQSVTIDWLSFTFKDGENAAKFYARNVCPDKEVTTAPRFGYDRAYASPNGMVRLASLANPRMGAHYIFSGGTLAALFNEGVSPFAILADAVACGAKVTRLDLAKDVINEGIQIDEIWNYIQAGNYKGSSQSHARIQSDKGGYTIYVGSRVSERFIRIYDKGVENGSGMDWKRCEIELKGDTAKAIARVLVGGDSKPGETFDALSRGMFDCNANAWKSFRGEDVPCAIPKIEKQTDREAWIGAQVVPAVLDHLKEHPESQATYTLYHLLDERLRDIM